MHKNSIVRLYSMASRAVYLSLCKQRASLALTALPLSCLTQHQTSRSLATRPSVQQQGAQNSLPAAYYRGGTSRAIFFRQGDLPSDRAEWTKIFLGAIGSPDPYGRQLDGLGGGISSLSKVCVVGPSSRPDADVDYTFVAIGVRDADLDYSSNCGNMSSAVGPFAVDSKMFDVQSIGDSDGGGDNLVTVRIYNTNTGKIINATFPVVDGEAAASGDFGIDGVAGAGARVRLDFVRPAGSRTGMLLPTGRAADEVGGVRATLIDAGNPCCLVPAADLGVDGAASARQIDADPALLARLEAVRRQAAVMMGLAATADEAPGSVPKIAFVSPPPPPAAAAAAPAGDVVVRAMSVGQPHRAIPVTVALAVAAAAKLPGTTVAECLRADEGQEGIDISHASGNLMVGAKFDSQGHLEFATVYRTARRLMEGRVFWKK